MSGIGGGAGAFGNVSADVPVSSKNIVQSLKEIVSCSDLEIYAMLVECDMDPDETVSRLLSQGLISVFKLFCFILFPGFSFGFYLVTI